LYTADEFSKIEELMERQSEVLQMITQGKSLTDALNILTNWVETQSSDGLIASILCTDSTGLYLYHCAGNSLPKDYIEAINGLTIGPEAGSCGTAAHTKKPVVVENIEESILWKNYKDVALKHNLRSCWSTPLVNNEGKLRGTFSVYDKVPKKHVPRDLQLIALVAHTVLLAIEYKVAEDERQKDNEQKKLITENIKKSEQRFQNLVREAPVGIVVLRGEEMIVDVVNEIYGKLIDRTPAQLLNKPLFDVIPDAEKPFRALLDEVRITGKQVYLYDHPYYVVVEGKEIRGYLNIVCQPYKEFDGTITGVIALCHDVTEIVEVHKKLEQSEAQFRNLVMQAPVAIAVFKGEDLIAETVNDYYLPLVGKTREEFVGKSLLQTLPEAKETIEPLARKLFSTGQPLVVNEYDLFVNRNGKRNKCYFNSIWKPIFELDGSVNGFIAIAHEITEQVEARRKIEESEQKIRSVIESAPFPIGVYAGREMRIQFVNQSIIDVWGKGGDVVGKLYSEVLPELANQQMYGQLDKVFTTGIPFHAKNQRVNLVVNGILQSFYFNYSFTPLYDAQGNMYGVMNTAADVTELAVAYNKLEESEERARLAIEASEQGTFHINLQTNELIASQRMAEIFDVEQTAGRSGFVSAIHPDDLIVRDNAYKTAYQTSILEYEGRLIKKDGFVIWMRVKGKVYFSAENEPVRLVGSIQDITEQKKFAEALAKKVEEQTAELRQANKQLIAINDELQQFAYVSSHDLQEPLRKIRVFADMLTKQIDKEGEVSVYLHKIISSAERMTGLIQSLLEYSRVANAQVRFEKLDLNILLKTILTDYELLISQKEAIINIDTLPQIEAVPLQMNQLFFNLIGNALKFSKRGVQPVIKIMSEPLSHKKKTKFPELEIEKEYIKITVQDNGIGFDQAFATKIFTVFQRLNDRSNFGGYGIGLALCKKVVQAHEGIIFAEGELKQGATFTIILPLQQ
jgi:PAS domain S-box-containing protein